MRWTESDLNDNQRVFTPLLTIYTHLKIIYMDVQLGQLLCAEVGRRAVLYIPDGWMDGNIGN